MSASSVAVSSARCGRRRSVSSRACERTPIDPDETAGELEARLAEGTTYGFWTFNGRVPGPMLRARVGDTLTIPGYEVSGQEAGAACGGETFLKGFSGPYWLAYYIE